ncbi:Cupredoxin [Halenospora varia]|nr:Cupredoxin [Halenospora varia]
MRFSAVAALCAAPLALAGSFDLLRAREASLMRRQESVQVQAAKGGNNGASVEVKQSNNGNTQVTEIIIIWVNQGGNAATSTVNSAMTQTGGAAVSGATHTVVVGGAAGLVYNPESITAAVGDMVIFTFMSANHTVTQSAFTSPCVKLEGGMDSGFMANANNSVVPAPQMAMQVTVATPIWFYCKQKGHCGKGMAFSINPTADKSQEMFKQMAIAQNGTGATAVIVGGQASATSAAAAPPATNAAAPPAPVQSSAAGTMVGGTGTNTAGGACACSCLCGTAAFPNAAVQGVGAFGGMSGAMPMSALEA